MKKKSYKKKIIKNKKIKKFKNKKKSQAKRIKRYFKIFIDFDLYHKLFVLSFHTNLYPIGSLLTKILRPVKTIWRR